MAPTATAGVVLPRLGRGEWECHPHQPHATLARHTHRRPARPRLVTTHLLPHHALATPSHTTPPPCYCLHSPTPPTPSSLFLLLTIGMPSPANAIHSLSPHLLHPGATFPHTPPRTPTGISSRMTHTWVVHQVLLPILSGETDSLPVALLHPYGFAHTSHHVDMSGLCDSRFSLAILWDPREVWGDSGVWWKGTSVSPGRQDGKVIP